MESFLHRTWRVWAYHFDRWAGITGWALIRAAAVEAVTAEAVAAEAVAAEAVAAEERRHNLLPNIYLMIQSLFCSLR